MNTENDELRERPELRALGPAPLPIVDSFYLEGNFCDMFDCGEYTYAVDNLMHLGLGNISITRIDKDFKTKVLYDNDPGFSSDEYSCLEYVGNLKDGKECLVIASGQVRTRGDRKEYKEDDTTIVIRIKECGDLLIEKQLSFTLHSFANSMAKLEDCIYFGQSKMITCLDLSTGETTYFTNKKDEELEALVHSERKSKLGFLP